MLHGLNQRFLKPASPKVSGTKERIRNPDVRRFLRPWCTIAVSPKRKEEEPWPYSHDAFRIRCTVCTCAPQRALRIRLPAPGPFLWTGSPSCSPATGSSHGRFVCKGKTPPTSSLYPAFAPRRRRLWLIRTLPSLTPAVPWDSLCRQGGRPLPSVPLSGRAVPPGGIPHE